MPRIRRLEIVAAGVQRNGKPVDEAVLKSVVRNFNRDARPPVTLGHPAKGDDKVAALGRIDNLQLITNSEGKLALCGEQIYTPELEALEDEGKFEGQSAGIYPHPGKEGEYYLHHVAQLGQLPPAADIKTQATFELSDDGFDDCFTLSAYLVGDQNKQERNSVMNFKDLMKAIESYSDDEKKQLGEALGFKGGEDDPSSKKKETQDGDKEKGGEVTPSGDEENQMVKQMQETMAKDRRDQLTELANSASLTDGMKTVITSMIKNASTIELCNAGDDSRFNEIKSLIKAQPDKPALNPFEDIELSDDGKQVSETFDSNGW